MPFPLPVVELEDVPADRPEALTIPLSCDLFPENALLFILPVEVLDEFPFAVVMPLLVVVVLVVVVVVAAAGCLPLVS